MQGSRSRGTRTVLVVIVNYRTAGLTVECLKSLQPEVAANPGTRVVVVDNQSQDGSYEALRSAVEAAGWSDWAQVVLAPRNGGFAYGNNHAIRPALASDDPPVYYWLLNPDTLVRPGGLSALVDFFEAHPFAGIAGGLLEESDGTPWPYAFRFPSIVSELERGLRFSVATRLLSRWCVVRRMDDNEAQVDWLPGASMMVRREVFDSIGLMDEGYFLYFEETDFCLQARRAHWTCWYVPKSRVMHIAGQSTGVTDKRSAGLRLPTYWFESRRRYFVKNFGPAYAIATDLTWLLAFLTYRVRKWIQRKRDIEPPRLLSDFIRNSAILNAKGGMR
jgi:GT2 family glycosyltransferase